MATQEGTSSQIVDPQASFLEAPNSSSLQVRNGRVSSGVAGEEAAPSPPPHKPLVLRLQAASGASWRWELGESSPDQ